MRTDRGRSEEVSFGVRQCADGAPFKCSHHIRQFESICAIAAVNRGQNSSLPPSSNCALRFTQSSCKLPRVKHGPATTSRHFAMRVFLYATQLNLIVVHTNTRAIFMDSKNVRFSNAASFGNGCQPSHSAALVRGWKGTGRVSDKGWPLATSKADADKEVVQLRPPHQCFRDALYF